MINVETKPCRNCNDSNVVASFCLNCSSFTDDESEFYLVIEKRYQDQTQVLKDILLKRYEIEEFQVRTRITPNFIDEGVAKFDIIFKGVVNLTDYDNIKKLDFDYLRELDGVIGIQIFRNSIYVYYDIYHFILPTEIGRSIHGIKKFNL